MLPHEAEWFRNVIAPEPRHWWLTKDGDVACLALYERHYSAHQYKDGRVRKLFCGPGQKIVLRSESGDAVFVWRKFIDRSGQHGINCAVFRNEGPILSSELVRQADAIADFCWPGIRHYTYVSAKSVRSRNPGFCFLAAGWRRCGHTQGGLLILERDFLGGRDAAAELVRMCGAQPINSDAMTAEQRS